MTATHQVVKADLRIDERRRGPGDLPTAAGLVVIGYGIGMLALACFALGWWRG